MQYSSSMSQSWGSSTVTGGSSSLRGGSLGGQGRISSSRVSSYGISSGQGSGMRMSSGMGLGLSSGLGYSSSGGISSGGGFSISSSSSSALTNEKQTMQSLNDRLAVYLQKVSSLEKLNAEIEMEIKQFYQQAGPATRDYSEYWAIINGLRDQINNMILANSEMMLQVDNSKLAAEDFKNKFETELAIRMSVENDINNLRMMLDNLTLEKSELESEIENLKEELIYIRKNHEEELRNLRSQISGNVSVEVKAQDSADLLKVLAELRGKYEAMANQNREEAQEWYKQQCATVQQEMTVNTSAVDGEKSKLTEVRRSCQGLETELSTLQGIIASLERNLDEVDLRFAGERDKLQMTIGCLEGELAGIRAKIVSMCEEYQRLLNIKNRLEAEIETYRRLLGGCGVSSSSSSGQASSSSTITKTVVKEERVPVVSTETRTYTVVEKVLK